MGGREGEGGEQGTEDLRDGCQQQALTQLEMATDCAELLLQHCLMACKIQTPKTCLIGWEVVPEKVWLSAHQGYSPS